MSLDPVPSPAPVPDAAEPRPESPQEVNATVTDPRHIEAFELLNKQLHGEGTKSALRKTVTLLVSLALFVVWIGWRNSGGGGAALTRGALLVGVLLLHELGHFLAMKHFGYRDVSMFFIPFFGAAVSGRKMDVRPAQEVLMILAGPLPGILLGVPLLLFASAGQHPLLKQAAVMLILINGINLLPIKPLDGGRFFELVIFCRWRWISVLFGFLSVIGFAYFMIELAGFSPLVVLFLTVFQLSVAWRQRQLRVKLREREISMCLQPDGGVLPDQAVGIFRTIEDVFFPSKVTPANLAKIACHHLHAHKPVPPGVAASLGLLAVYLGAILLMIGGFIANDLINPDHRLRWRQIWSKITRTSIDKERH